MLDTLVQSLTLMLVGMTGVFLSLLFLAGMIWLFKFADEQLNARRIQNYSKKVELKEVDEEVNDEVIAVITAAVSTTLKKKIIVKKIRFLSNRVSGTWTSTGRLNVMASHLVQKKG